MERMLMEYLVNSLWQAPVLAAGAWLVLRAGRSGPRVQHGVWVAALVLMVAMPLLSSRGAGAEGAAIDPEGDLSGGFGRAGGPRLDDNLESHAPGG